MNDPSAPGARNAHPGHERLENLNIASHQVLVTPDQLKARLPATESVRETVQAARDAVRAILARRDHRLLVVVGPCSIHDVDAARDYARRLRVWPTRSATACCW